MVHVGYSIFTYHNNILLVYILKHHSDKPSMGYKKDQDPHWYTQEIIHLLLINVHRKHKSIEKQQFKTAKLYWYHECNLKWFNLFPFKVIQCDNIKKMIFCNYHIKYLGRITRIIFQEVLNPFWHGPWEVHSCMGGGGLQDPDAGCSFWGFWMNNFKQCTEIFQFIHLKL